MKMHVCCVLAGLVMASVSYGADKELLDLKAGDLLVARYQSAGLPKKPYVKEIYSPSGVQVTVDSPADHFHHHGLMFAISAGGTDFWTEKPFEKYGSQIPRSNETETTSSGFKQKLDWTAPGEKKVLIESRELKVRAPKSGEPNILTWSTILETAANETVKLEGSHYFGLGVRFPGDMNDKAKFIFPENVAAGDEVRVDKTLPKADWCAVTGSIGGKTFTVAMWDSPDNTRRATWFTMTKPFSYLSATLNLHKQAMDLKPGVKLLQRYGVAVFDGAAASADIEKARSKWIEESKHLM